MSEFDWIPEPLTSLDWQPMTDDVVLKDSRYDDNPDRFLIAGRWGECAGCPEFVSLYVATTNINKFWVGDNAVPRENVHAYVRIE